MDQPGVQAPPETVREMGRQSVVTGSVVSFFILLSTASMDDGNATNRVVKVVVGLGTNTGTLSFPATAFKTGPAPYRGKFWWTLYIKMRIGFVGTVCADAHACTHPHADDDSIPGCDGDDATVTVRWGEPVAEAECKMTLIHLDLYTCRWSFPEERVQRETKGTEGTHYGARGAGLARLQGRGRPTNLQVASWNCVVKCRVWLFGMSLRHTQIRYVWEREIKKKSWGRGKANGELIRRRDGPLAPRFSSMAR